MSDKKRKFLIKSTTEIDEQTGNSLYWSNEWGFVNKEEATEFTEQEYNKFDLSNLHGGTAEWEEIDI